MVLVLLATSQTRITSGRSRYIFFRNSIQGACSERSTPLSFFFFASRWTAMKMPVKYNTAGSMAVSAILP